MSAAELTEVRLYGALGQRFGRSRRLAVGSPAEAIRALCATVPGFKAHLQGPAHQQPYRVLVGTETVTADELRTPSGHQVIKIVPVYAGAKSAVGQIILGVALVAATYGVNIAVAGALMGLGTSMIVGGISRLLASPPDLNPPGSVGGKKQDPNYLFGGPANTISQGGPVPVGYGELLVGGVVVSAGLVPETPNSRGQFGGLGDGNGTLLGDGDTTPWVASVAVQ